MVRRGSVSGRRLGSSGHSSSGQPLATIPESTGAGPTSSRAVGRSARRWSNPAENSTVWRRCLTQYSGRATSSPAGAPVRLDTKTTPGASRAAFPTSPANSSSTPSTASECPARPNPRCLTRRPLPVTRPATASTSAAGPETTVFCGPLTAATDSRAPSSPAIRATSRALTSTTAIAPSTGSESSSRPRAATRRIPSASPITPAACAAANSPRLCPITASGRTPHDRHSVNNAV